MAPRPLQARDLACLLAVQRACYGDGFIEGADVYARRLASPAQCSWVLERDGGVCAYLAAYRSVRGKVTPLHGDFDAGPQEAPAADTLYLHDLAVLPALTGQGLAQALLQALWAQAQADGLAHSALVAVQGSQRFWERHGYAAQPLACGIQRQRLAAYGADAQYMARPLL